MDPKVSINLRLSKVQHNNISFKNKRRRKSPSCAPKLHTPQVIQSSERRVQTQKCNVFKAIETSPKHRWKLNGSGSNERSTSIEHCMTNTRQQIPVQNFQQEIPQNNSPHVETRQQHEISRNCFGKAHHFITAESFQHDNSSLKHQQMPVKGGKGKPQRRDFVNCRKLLDWTTASSVRKLLPIFILVNMLPFLYAGESRINYTSCMKIVAKTLMLIEVVVNTLPF